VLVESIKKFHFLVVVALVSKTALSDVVGGPVHDVRAVLVHNWILGAGRSGNF
jgi:hypothetical protein